MPGRDVWAIRKGMDQAGSPVCKQLIISISFTNIGLSVALMGVKRVPTLLFPYSKTVFRLIYNSSNVHLTPSWLRFF